MPDQSERPLVIFDLDGTLIDTAPDLMASLNHTIAGAGLQPVAYEDITHLVGQGARAMIARAFRFRERTIADHEIDPLLDTFIEHYEANMPGASKPYPGLMAALDRLESAGFATAVCTNKIEGLARRLLESLGLAHRFAAITGGDTFPVRKPHAGHIEGTIAAAGATKARAIMIGDSINDIAAARNAGIPSLAVPFGYSDIPVAELGATAIIAHYDMLTVELVKGLGMVGATGIEPVTPPV